MTSASRLSPDAVRVRASRQPTRIAEGDHCGFATGKPRSAEYILVHSHSWGRRLLRVKPATAAAGLSLLQGNRRCGRVWPGMVKFANFFVSFYCFMFFSFARAGHFSVVCALCSETRPIACFGARMWACAHACVCARMGLCTRVSTLAHHISERVHASTGAADSSACISTFACEHAC